MAKILLVEDNSIAANDIKRMLHKNGYDVSVALDGQEAIAIVGKDEFDVVITDLLIPHVNGLELIQKLKQGGARKNLKIIVVSGIDNELTMAEAYKLGADDYLIKPVVAFDLISSINKLAGTTNIYT
jgi:CheY-like chemotaxis protein